MLIEFFVPLTIVISFVYLYFRITVLVDFTRYPSIVYEITTGIFIGIFAVLLNYIGIYFYTITFFTLSLAALILGVILTKYSAVAISSIIFACWIYLSPDYFFGWSLAVFIFIIILMLIVHRIIINLNLYLQGIILIVIAKTVSYYFVGFSQNYFNHFLTDYLYQIVLSSLMFAIALNETLYLSKSNELTIKYRHEANVDYLTNLYNRRALYEKIDKVKTPSLLIMFDVDWFKTINDTYGHKEGDELLINIGKALKSEFGIYGSIFRVGGDEFYVLVDKSKLSKKEACKKAEKFQRYYYESTTGDTMIISLSYGCAETPEDGTTIRELFDISDKSLYELKEKRNLYDYK